MRRKKRVYIDEAAGLDIAELIRASATFLSYRAIVDEDIPFTTAKTGDTIRLSTVSWKRKTLGSQQWKVETTKESTPASARLSLHKKGRCDIVAQIPWYGEKLYVYLEPNTLINYAEFKLSINDVRDAMNRLERALLIALDFIPLNEREIDKFGKLKALALGSGATVHEQHTAGLMAVRLTKRMISCERGNEK